MYPGYPGAWIVAKPSVFGAGQLLLLVETILAILHRQLGDCWSHVEYTNVLSWH